jgi:acyl-CoA thioester hydrolase
MINPGQPTELANHPVSIELPVQWGDQDAFGHVNNAVYFRWMESARMEYFRRAGLAMGSDQGAGPILASFKCDFRRQLNYPDTVLISASVASIGRTSLKMVHKVYSQTQQAVVAEGDSVIVMFEYTHQRPILVADSIRETIDALEGRSNQPAM